jgi:1,4-dihydroxy-2-naphthoate octaprenyltransferase
VLLYALGAAIAAYLGRPIDATLYLIGQVLVTLLQQMTHYLNEYFDSETDQENSSRTWLSGGSGATGPEGLPKKVALYAAVITLALATTISTAALVTGAFPLNWGAASAAADEHDAANRAFFCHDHHL